MRGDEIILTNIGPIRSITRHTWEPQPYTPAQERPKYRSLLQAPKHGTIRARIMAILPSMPAEFTEPDVREALGIAKSNCAAMISMLATAGIIEHVNNVKVGGRTRMAYKLVKS